MGVSVVGVPHHLDDHLPDLDFALPPDEIVTAEMPNGDMWARPAYWADPRRNEEGEIYRVRTGGRGVYFPVSDGHLMELLTRDLTGRAI